MLGYCRLISKDDSTQTMDLWSRALSGTNDFHLTRQFSPAALTTEASGLIGAFDSNGRLLSVLRACVVMRARDLEPHTDLWPRMPPLLPTLLLKHAATRPEHQQRGLNTLLRYRLLNAAHAAGFASTCGLMPSRGSRARALSEVGYAAFGETTQVDGLVARSGPWRLFVLDLSTPTPVTRLRTMTTGIIRRYPWWGEELDLKIDSQTPPPPVRAGNSKPAARPAIYE